MPARSASAHRRSSASLLVKAGTLTLTPFGIYCIVFGAAMIIYNA